MLLEEMEILGGAESFDYVATNFLEVIGLHSMVSAVNCTSLCRV